MSFSTCLVCSVGPHDDGDDVGTPLRPSSSMGGTGSGGRQTGMGGADGGGVTYGPCIGVGAFCVSFCACASACACSSLTGSRNEARKGEGEGEGSGETCPYTFRRLLHPPESSWLLGAEVNARVPTGLPDVPSSSLLAASE